MKEKERYELREKIYNMSNSFLPLDKFYNDIESMAILSSFDEEFAFKDLEKIADFILDLQKQLEELEESYNRTMRYLNATRSQLLNLPKKIVEEIRKDMSERIIEKQIKYGDNIQADFICNVINESLDTILKKVLKGIL